MNKRATKTQATQAKILTAAERLFTSKGYAGTSISDIAKSAEINQSLIYHHYKDKMDLWQATKSSILQRSFDPEHLDKALNAITLRDFLKHYIVMRYEFYEKNPTVRRMIAWQSLEEDETALALGGVAGKSIFRDIFSAIVRLQHKGEIRANIAPEYALCLLIQTTSSRSIDIPQIYPLYDPNTTIEKDLLIATMIDCTFRALTPTIE